MGIYTCDECNGTGTHELLTERGEEHVRCGRCDGAGEIDGCDECRGTGYLEDYREALGLSMVTCYV